MENGRVSSHGSYCCVLFPCSLVHHPGLTSGPSLCPGDESDVDAHWKTCLPLWLALLRGDKLPAEEAAELTARRDAWAPVMYDALTRAMCDAVARLELGYTVARPDAADAADAAADPVRHGVTLYDASVDMQEQASLLSTSFEPACQTFSAVPPDKPAVPCCWAYIGFNQSEARVLSVCVAIRLMCAVCLSRPEH